MKWILIIIGVLAAVVGAVVLIGMTLPQNHTASRTARVSLAPDALWDVVTDVDKYPSWRKDVDSVQRVEGAAMTWREVSGSDRITYEAAVSERPSRFVAHIADKGLPFGGTWDYRIVPDGSGSRITITENGEVYNPMFRFVSRYVMGHTSTMDKYLAALAAKTGDAYVP